MWQFIVVYCDVFWVHISDIWHKHPAEMHKIKRCLIIAHCQCTPHTYFGYTFFWWMLSYWPIKLYHITHNKNLENQFVMPQKTLSTQIQEPWPTATWCMIIHVIDVISQINKRKNTKVKHKNKNLMTNTFLIFKIFLKIS